MAVIGATVLTLFVQVMTKAVCEAIVVVSEPTTAREAFAVSVFHGAPFFVTVQEFTFAIFHDTVTMPFFATRFGRALNETAEELMVTTTESVTVDDAVVDVELPPGPVQVIEYVVLEEGVTSVLPERSPPVVKPLEVQEVAFAETHVSVTDSPGSMTFLLAVSVTVGGAIVMTTDDVAVTVVAGVDVAEDVPPGPVQVIEYVVLAVGVTSVLPERSPPVAKPLEVQEVAPIESHVSVTDSPRTTDVLSALSVTETGATGALIVTL